MPVGTVVLTPGCAAFAPADIPVLDLRDEPAGDQPGADWVAHAAIGITQALARGGGRPPLLLIAAGARAADMPRLGFAQRSARRALAGYVLVDPVLPTPGAVSDWPDAPVTVVLTPEADDSTRTAAMGARLRGWEVIEADADDALSALAQRL